MSLPLRTGLVLVPLALAAASAGLHDRAAAAAQDDGEVIVGDGEHRYRWDAAWPALPDGFALGNTHGCVAVDAEGRVYFNTDAEHAIVVIGADGQYERSFGKEWAGGMHGMCIVTEGDAQFLYVTHTGRHEVGKLTLAGEVVWTVGWPEASGLYEGAGQYRPTAIAVRPDGGFYVADGYGRSWVHEYGADRQWKRAFGGPGTDPGRMRTPHGLWMDLAGEAPVLVVADRENHRLQRYSLEGEHLGVFEAELRRPCNLARVGGMYAVADLTGRVTLVDAEKGTRLAHLAEQPDPARRAQNGVERDAWRPGEFLSPHGIAAGPDGALYVEDWNRHGRVTRLVPVR